MDSDSDTGTDDKRGTEDLTRKEMGSEEKMESDREESFQEEPLLALERFPDPVWCRILEFLEAPKDLINVSKTCWDLNVIVARDQSKWVPPIRMVLPLVAPYLSKVDILNCRQVSWRLCSDMDRFLTAHPYRKFYVDANYTAPGNFSMFSTTLNCQRYCDPDVADEFVMAVQTHCFKNGDRNPFVGRTLHLKLNGPWDMMIHKRFIGNVINKFLLYSTFRNHFWHVKITGEDVFDKQSLLWELLTKIFSAIRNIKSVVVDLPAGCLLQPSEEKDFLIKAKINPIPKLRHSGPVSVEFTHQDRVLNEISQGLPIMYLVIINQLHSQLSKIDMDLDLEKKKLFQFKYQCAHLKALRLSGMSVQSLIFLERFEAPLLEQLTLEWKKRGVLNSEVPRPISMMYLGMIVGRFKNLRVLKMDSIGPKIELFNCIWNITIDSCHPIRKSGSLQKQKTNEKKKKRNVESPTMTQFHNRDYHESLVWMVIPRSVKEVHLKQIKLLRPSFHFNFSFNFDFIVRELKEKVQSSSPTK